MAINERLPATRIEKSEVEGLLSLNCMQDIAALFLGAELVAEVIAIGMNFILRESHSCLRSC